MSQSTEPILQDTRLPADLVLTLAPNGEWIWLRAEDETPSCIWCGSDNHWTAECAA